jgi:hypothetical protein
MGLTNKYIGEPVQIGADEPIGSPAWFHRWANAEQGTALAECEATGIANDFKERIKTIPAVKRAEDLPADELERIVEELYEAEDIGRILEADEVEFLAQHEDYAVIDV